MRAPTDQSAEPAQTETAIGGAAHTPGPWSIVPQNGAGPMIAREYETGKQMNAKGLRLVCHVLARGNSLPEDEANARLIAAAPDGLEAAETAYLALLMRGHDEWRWRNQKVFGLLLDFIAKATGREPQEVQDEYEARAALSRAAGEGA